jgi:hypothetical protein
MEAVLHHFFSLLYLDHLVPFLLLVFDSHDWVWLRSAVAQATHARRADPCRNDVCVSNTQTTPDHRLQQLAFFRLLTGTRQGS